MTQRTVKISFSDSDRVIELPLLSGTIGPDVIDTRALGAQGLFTYDPGFLSTASCASNGPPSTILRSATTGSPEAALNCGITPTP